MPTTTFFNLPPPKREKLLRAAVAEFARRPYGEVSINRIIQAAEIPRGSFYQYFADKTDLFRYVLQTYGCQVLELASTSLDACGGRLLWGGFARKHPPPAGQSGGDHPPGRGI